MKTMCKVKTTLDGDKSESDIPKVNLKTKQQKLSKLKTVNRQQSKTKKAHRHRDERKNKIMKYKSNKQPN